MKITVEFITSAADVAGLPNQGLREVAMVGRSNVGKSSLINALVGQAAARTSRTPGKTRLANVFRVQRGHAPAFFLVDLPGFGFTKSGAGSQQFEPLARSYFERDVDLAAVLLVDARHPGLENDRAAWRWLRAMNVQAALVGTKMDKLARGQRIRAQQQLESVFEDSVLPVSAVTGEGLDELWKLIDRLVATSQTTPPHNQRNRPPKAMAPRPQKR